MRTKRCHILIISINVELATPGRFELPIFATGKQRLAIRPRCQQYLMVTTCSIYLKCEIGFETSTSVFYQILRLLQVYDD